MEEPKSRRHIMAAASDIRARFAAAQQAEETSPAKATEASQPTLPGLRKGLAPRKWQASPKQIELIRTMLSERFEQEEAEARSAAFDWETMDRGQFSKIFNWLKTRPRRKMPVVVTEPVSDETSDTVELIEGTFTIDFGAEGHVTLKVKRQPQHLDFKPGELLLSYLTGPDNDNDYTRFGHLDARSGQVRIWKKHQGNAVLAEAVKVLVGDPKAAAQAYARQSGNCARCGRTLTVPASLNAGLGPDCAQAVNW